MNRTCVMALAAGLAVSVAHANDIDWASPVDGFWDNATNWSPMTVPTDAADVAILGLSGPYTVNMDLSPSIDGLSITNPEAVFEIPAARVLTLGTAGIFNDGWIIINPTSVGFTTSLSLNQDSTIDGSGLLSLNSAGGTARIISGTDALITHGVDHTINGFGQIALRFDNQGYIVADSLGNTFTISGGPKANSGVIAATDGGTMFLSNTTIDQSAGGILEANGGQLNLTGSTVIGGNLLNGGLPGSLITLTSSTLDGVTIDGEVQQATGNTVTVAGGSLENNGTLLINPNSTGFTTSLDFPESTVISGSGTLRLNGAASTARMTGSNIGVENGTNHTIRGYGQILVDLINSGQLAADTTAQTLLLSGGNKINLSTMRAESGGQLQFQSMTLNQSPAAEIIADGGEVNLSSNTTIVDGSLRNLNTPGSSGIISSTTTLEDVAVEGDWSLNAAVTLTLRGTTTNNGTITVNPTGQGFVTSVNLPTDATLTGSGVLRLNAPASTARVTSSTGQLLTHDAGHSIRGFGQISALMLNNGAVVADVDDQVIQLSGQTKVNNATFRAEAGGGLQFQSTTIDQTGGGTIEADGGPVSITATTVLGGTIINTGAVESSVNFATVTLDNCTLTGDASVNAATALTITGGTLTNNGVLIVNPTAQGFVTNLTADGMTDILGTGEIRLNSNTTTARLLNSAGDMLTLGAGQTLTGIGQIAAETQITGTLAPGLSVGTMSASRPVTLDSSATMLCEFNNIGQADKLMSTSTLTLAGSLEIAFIDGYTASSPEAFEIITTGTNGVIGRFDQVIGDAPPAPLITRVLYESNRVRVGFTCIGDANLDGATDLADLNAILAGFGTNASLGDLNDDGAIDLADLNIILANFGTPCP